MTIQQAANLAAQAQKRLYEAQDLRDRAMRSGDLDGADVMTEVCDELRDARDRADAALRAMFTK